MVGEAPPHDSDDECDDLAALDFSITEGEQVESDLDALGDYAEEPTEDDELPVPVFAVTLTASVPLLAPLPGVTLIQVWLSVTDQLTFAVTDTFMDAVAAPNDSEVGMIARNASFG